MLTEANTTSHLLLPALVPERGAPLEQAYDQIAAAFRGAGMMVFVPDLAIARSPVRDFTRYFHIAGGELPRDVCCLVFVATQMWTPARTQLFLQTHLPMITEGRLRRRVGRLRFVFRSAWPLDPATAYLFADAPCSHLELRARELLRQGALDPAQAPDLAWRARELMQELLSLDVSLDSLETVGVLNDVILDYMRAGTPRELAMEVGAFVPQAALTLLGLLLGEVIRRNAPSEARWCEPPEQARQSHSPALRIYEGEGRLSYVFPIDRVLQLYQSGQDRDLQTYYEAVVLEVLSGRRQEEKITDLRSLAGALVPVLKNARWNARQSAVCTPLLEGGPPNQPLVALALHQEQRLSYVSCEKPARWQVTPDDLLELAQINLIRQSPRLEQHLRPMGSLQAPEVLHLSYRDPFNAARLLLVERLYQAARQRCPGVRAFLVAAPARDHLLLAPWKGSTSLQRFQEVVLGLHERYPAPISTLCLLLDENGLRLPA